MKAKRSGGRPKNTLRLYRGAYGTYFWQIVDARNKKIKADGGEGYYNLASCRRACARLFPPLVRELMQMDYKEEG